jgi:CubicO group peptidase (beta-lactamase class C family)
MRSTSATLAGLLWVALAVPAAAQEAPSIVPPNPLPPGPVAAVDTALPAEAEAATSPGHPLTREDLGAWLDGFLPYALERGDVAGAVVVVVRDGEILLQKGYGYSDVATRAPVDPERTLFRPGSVSKLFTWTAVMQLVEQRKLDLDADINGYLDFEIPPREGPPITMRHLLTHTPGFDEVVRALMVSEVEDLMPLDEAVKRWVPPRVVAAGSTPAYSNYGTALAGYIVQRVSGMSFDDYIDGKILAPLGMTHSTFRQPLPQRLVPHMSKGYELGSEEPRPFELISLAPAGSLSASGADMGRFMIAHLQKGEYRGRRILGEATAVAMHETAAPSIPPLRGMRLGFYPADKNGHRVIAHGGDTQWFHSDLNLFLDDGVGVFVSVNSPGKEGAAGPIRNALLTAFADRYFPDRPAGAARQPAQPDAVDEKTSIEHAAQLAGTYQFSRRSHTTFTALAYFFEQMKVAAEEDGTILVSLLTGVNGKPKKWREVAPYLWQNVGGDDRLGAEVDGGRVVRFIYESYPFMAFEPVPWWASSAWLLPLWAGGLAALLLTVLAWPISALVRRRYHVPYFLSGRDATAHRRIRIASLVVFLTVVAAAVTVALMFSDLKWLAPGVEHWVMALRITALVALVGGAATALWNAWVVLRSQRRWPAKVWSVVLTVSFLTLLWVGIVYRMVGFSGEL